MRNFLDHFEEYAILTLFPILVAVVLLATAARYFQLFPMFWGEELARYIMVYLGYIGIALAMKRRAHVGVATLVNCFPSRGMRRLFKVVQLAFVLLFAGIISYFLYEVIAKQSAIGQTSPALFLPIAVPYFAVPFGMVLMAIRAVQNFVADWRAFEED